MQKHPLKFSISSILVLTRLKNYLNFNKVLKELKHKKINRLPEKYKAN